jgi:hypothetical protein
MNGAAAHAVGGLHPELPGWTDQLALAIAAPRNDHDLRIDQSDRIVVEADTPERRSVRWAKLVIVLAASIGLGWAGLFAAHRFLRSDRVSPPLPVQSPSEGHRSETHPTIVRKADRSATASRPHGPNLRPPTRTATAKHTRAVPPAPSASSYVPPAPSPAAGATKPPVEARLTPVPETRPTTIDGWVLREVVNGTAVLEGPDGIWRVKRGDTVPGVGQVVEIFAWGNRMIVATDKGLITTP